MGTNRDSVFISYNHLTASDTARDIAEALKAVGLDPWNYFIQYPKPTITHNRRWHVGNVRIGTHVKRKQWGTKVMGDRRIIIYIILYN
jgi:hypothetical protein